MKWCFFHQRIMGLFPEADNRWSAATRRHFENCAACRETLDQERAIIVSLRGSARRSGSEFPRVLRARIVAHLDDRGSRDPGSWLIGRWVQLGAVAVAVVAVLMVVWPRPSSDAQPPGGMAMATKVGAAPSAQTARMTWLAEPSMVWQWTELGGGPLEGELASAIDDGRRLFSAVVHSCVPEPTAELVLARAESWMTSGR